MFLTLYWYVNFTYDKYTTGDISTHPSGGGSLGEVSALAFGAAAAAFWPMNLLAAFPARNNPEMATTAPLNVL